MESMPFGCGLTYKRLPWTHAPYLDTVQDHAVRPSPVDEVTIVANNPDLSRSPLPPVPASKRPRAVMAAVAAKRARLD